MSKLFTSLAVAAAALTLVAGSVAEARQGRVAARGQNGAVVAGAGPNGGAGVRARGCTQGDTSATCASGGAVRGPNGGRGARASTTTVNEDGSATRRSGLAAQGSDGGTLTSTGSTTRNADGTVNGARSTSATAADGSTYQGTTTYDPATGVTRTTTCTDASGAVVACPR